MKPAKPESRKRDQRLAQLTVALAGRDDLATRGQRILHLQVDQVGAEQGVRVGEGPDAALDEVGRVERRAQGRRAYGGDQVGAALGDVAVDPLLVLVREDQPVLLGHPGQGAHAVDDLAPVPLRRLASRDEEGKDADDGGTELRGDFGHPAHPVQLRTERRVDRDLADGGADRGDAYLGGVHRGAERGQLLAGEVGDVHRPRAAQLEIRDRLGGQGRELGLRVG